MDFAGFPLIGPASPVQRAAPDPPRPAIPPVEPVHASAGLTGRLPGRSSDRPGGDAGDGASGRGPTASLPRPDPDAPTGPPPAFEASLLDLEADLRSVLARLEAERGQRESEAASHAGPRAAALGFG